MPPPGETRYDRTRIALQEPVRMLQFLPKLSPTSFRCKMRLKEFSKSSQFFILRHIHIEFFILQPIVGIDANITLSVGINDKGIRGVLIPVCFQDFRPAVIGWITTSGKIRDCWNNYNRLVYLIPANKKISYFRFAAMNKPIIKTRAINLKI